MKLVLNFWERRWQSVTFDTDKGVGRVRWFAPKPRGCAGWASKRGGHWFAVWRSSKHLVFQAGARRWPMTDAYRCLSTAQKSTRTFSIMDANNTIFSVQYDADEKEFDPTYDELDRETADFLYWIAAIWNDSGLKAELAKTWVSSTVAEPAG